MTAAISALSMVLAACGGGSSSRAGGSSGASPSPVTGPCHLLSKTDFQAIGKKLNDTPIESELSSVHLKDCYFNLGSDNDAVYVDVWPSAVDGRQAFDGGKDPASGGGVPTVLTGLGDSAYWLPATHAVYVMKATKVFEVKIGESGASDAQLQRDATTLATSAAGRFN